MSMMQNIQQDTWKQMVGEEAAKLIEEGMVVGLGSGSTATFMIYALARRIEAGLHIVGAVPTSEATEQLAASLGIPITNLDTHPELDMDIDGADEIDEQLNLIKGGGGALLREKIVASCAKRFIVIGDITKQVPQLGIKTPLPIEVIPFAATPVSRRLETLGASVRVRQLGNQTFLTDNGNMILDCSFPNGIADLQQVNTHLKSIVGVAETGLFLNMAEQALIGSPNGVTYLKLR